MVLARLRGVFLGSKLRIVGSVLLGLVLLGALGFLFGVFGVPAVESVENRFGGVNESTTVIETDLVVSNPNPFGMKLGGASLEYAVSMNDVRMAEGTHRGLGIGAGNTTLNFTSYMDNGKIPAWWVSHVRNGEHTTVAVDATVHSSLLPVSVAAPEIEREISTDITAAFNTTETRPIDAGQPLVSDPILYLNETSGHWGQVTENRTEVVMDFAVYNPKPYPIGASEIGYDLSMNGIAVGEGATQSEVVIPPGETRVITATTSIRNERLDEWWVSHLERDQVTNLTIDFYARFDLSSGGLGTIQVPLDSMHSQFETDIFGNKDRSNASAGGGGGSDAGDGSGGADGSGSDEGGTGDATTATPTATATPTDEGGILDGMGTATPAPTTTPTPTATPAPTTTPTPTPTATPTPTDDGGLLG